MLKKRIEGGWARYMKETPIEPGEYYFYPGRPSDNLKRVYPFIPATQGKRFLWLLPCEDWIKREIENIEIKHLLKFNYSISLVEEKIKETPLRDWQKSFLETVFKTLSEGQQFRRGLVVPFGGGKTLVGLLLALLGHTLYLAPRHLHGEIKREAEKWGLPCPQISTPDSAKKHSGYQIIILDECLSCKNPLTARSKGVTALAKEAEIVLVMTGSPLSAKEELDARWLRVVGSIIPAEQKHWIWRWGINPRHEIPKGAEGRMPLNEEGIRLKPLTCDGFNLEGILEYTKENLVVIDTQEIMREIPPCNTERIYLKTPKLYNMIAQGLMTTAGIQKRLTQVRTCTSGFVYTDQKETVFLDKAPAKIEWVKNFLADNPTEPVVIFSHWQAEINKLEEELKALNPAIVTKDRKEAEKFTGEKTNLLICSASLSEGMNLQRSRVALFLSCSPSPDKLAQAKARLYRPLQTRGVIFYFLLCENTLDETTLDLLEKHQDKNKAFILKMLEKDISS